MTDPCDPQNLLNWGLNLRPNEIVTGSSTESAQEPSFTTQLKDISVSEGGEASFSCDVSGTPIPDVQWLLNGEKLQPSGKISTSFRYVSSCLNQLRS